jgi:hypothetical protein
MDSKKRITRKNFMDDIDRLMIDLSREGAQIWKPPPGGAETWDTWERGHPAGAEATGKAQIPDNREAVSAARIRASGFIILAIVVILSWLLFVLSKL